MTQESAHKTEDTTPATPRQEENVGTPGDDSTPDLPGIPQAPGRRLETRSEEMTRIADKRRRDQISVNVSHLLHHHDWGFPDLRDKSGLGLTALYNVVDARPTRAKTVEAIAKAFEIPPHWLWKKTPEKLNAWLSRNDRKPSLIRRLLSWLRRRAPWVS